MTPRVVLAQTWSFVMHKTSAIVSLATLLAFAAPAMAQTQAAAPTAKAGAATQGATTKPTKQQRTAKSLECSHQADGKNIHGKERRKFMSSCKKA
jgi:hypothetical protein